MEKINKLLFWVLMVIAGTVFASNAKDLYTANVPVASQSVKDRNTALPQALQSVLIKVSGNSGIATVPAVQSQLSKAATLLQAYRYEKQQKGSGYLLSASFEPAAIDRLLQASHQTVWGNDRPRLLVWVAKQEANQANLATTDTDPAIYQLLLNAGQARGLPLSFPVFDLDDVAAVQFTDIEKNHATVIVAASQRYPHNGIVALTLSMPNNKTYQGQWRLDLNGNQTQFITNGQTIEQVIRAGVNQLTDTLASQYSASHPNQSAGHYHLQVTGVKSVNDFARISHYLKQLAPVQQVSIEQVMPTQIIFNVTANGGKQLLQQAIALDSILQPDKQPATLPSQDTLLIYRVNL